MQALEKQPEAEQGESHSTTRGNVYQHYVDYLQGSEYGFALENLALYRIVLEKPRNIFLQ